jgi:hypothetical protein
MIIRGDARPCGQNARSSADQRERIVALAATPPPVPDDADAPSGDEPMRLVGGGNDLFVTIGILLLFAGALFALQSYPGVTVPLTAILGVFAWLVAEFVTRQKRMRLSSTVLGLGFIAAVLNAARPLSGKPQRNPGDPDNPVQSPR